MVIGRIELSALMGLGEMGLGPGTRLDMVSDDGRRRAYVGWQPEDGFDAEVTDATGEPSTTLVTLNGAYLTDDDAFELSGADMTGDASDEADPRAAASAWRRLTRGMRDLSASASIESAR